uniref:Uncharacterized protein n=1 Tax=Oryza barthii TaxID=65489 RepID=A0A0D3GMH7_9ORYZ
MAVRLVHSLADIEAAAEEAEAAGAGPVYFLIASDASLAEASAIRRRLGDGGPGGYFLFNPNMARRKEEAKACVDGHFWKLMKDWEGAIDDQITKVEGDLKEVDGKVLSGAALNLPCTSFQWREAFDGISTRTTVHPGNDPIPVMNYSAFLLVAPPLPIIRCAAVAPLPLRSIHAAIGHRLHALRLSPSTASATSL